MSIQPAGGLWPLNDEIDEAVASRKQQNPGQNVKDRFYVFASTIKLLSSAIKETLQYTTFVRPFQRVNEPLELGG